MQRGLACPRLKLHGKIRLTSAITGKKNTTFSITIPKHTNSKNKVSKEDQCATTCQNLYLKGKLRTKPSYF